MGDVKALDGDGLAGQQGDGGDGDGARRRRQDEAPSGGEDGGCDGVEGEDGGGCRVGGGEEGGDQHQNREARDLHVERMRIKLLDCCVATGDGQGDPGYIPCVRGWTPSLPSYTLYCPAIPCNAAQCALLQGIALYCSALPSTRPRMTRDPGSGGSLDGRAIRAHPSTTSQPTGQRWESAHCTQF